MSLESSHTLANYFQEFISELMKKELLGTIDSQKLMTFANVFGIR